MLGEAFTFSTSVAEGAGVIAAKDLDTDELFMRIPRSAMLTFETALQSPFGQLIVRDEKLAKSQSLATAMHLLFERLAGDKSRWAPYLAILPLRYTTPLHASLAELRALKGSAIYSGTLRMLAANVRQYVEMFQAHARAQRSTKLPDFTYAEFRWAVATLMARQNKVLARSFTPGSQPVTTIALIPGFDSLNHAPFGGDIKSAFDWPTQSSESYAHAPVKQGDQVYIDYGGRPNSLLFMYQGFVVPGLSTDRVLTRLNINVSDPLFKLKQNLLNQLGLAHAEMAVPVKADVGAAAGAVPPPHAPLVQWRDLWRVIAVHSMTKEELAAALVSLTKAFKESGMVSIRGLDGTAVLTALRPTGYFLAQEDCPEDWRERVYEALQAHVQPALEARTDAAADAAAAVVTGEAPPQTPFTALAKTFVETETKLFSDLLTRIEMRAI
jgi:hypothetical protein